MRRILTLVLFGVLVCGSGLTALAAESPSSQVSIFQMSDGSFYHPSSGTHGATRNEVLRALGLPEESDGSVLASVSEAHLTLVSAIRRGRALLLALPDDPVPLEERPLVASQDEWREVTLAVWLKDTDEVVTLTIQKKNTEVKLPADRPFDVKVVKTNGVNSLYEVSKANAIVVAVRYPILEPVVKGKATIGYRLSEWAVYTPYSAALHTPEMVEEGAEQLDGFVQAAFRYFREHSILSRAQKGRNIADVIDPNLAKTILVIEHLDASVLVKDPHRAVETVLVTIAANPENVYGYSKSSAAALGIAQFIPSTYTSMAKHSELGLIQNVEDGCTDPVNAVRAEVAYLDYILASMPATIRESYGSDTGKINEYLAAAYNGGSARVKYAIKIWDDQIAGILQPKQILQRARLRPETIGYVKKFRSAYEVVFTAAKGIAEKVSSAAINQP